MRIIFVRHGESLANESCQNQERNDIWSDTVLSKRGISQARLLGERLSEESIDAVYSSDYHRSRQTAEAVVVHHSTELEIEPLFGEKHNGETYDEFSGRIREALTKVMDKHDGQTVLLVAHGHTNREIMKQLGLEQLGNHVKWISQGNTCVNIFVKKYDGFQPIMVNSLSHLEEESMAVELYRQVQKMPLGNDVDGKTFLLKELLEKNGYGVDLISVVFDWRDLPIPAHIMDLLGDSTLAFHKTLLVHMYGSQIYLDPVWPMGLLKKGFVVTGTWDGKRDSMQITNGDLIYYPASVENDDIYEKHGIIPNGERDKAFFEALVQWLNG
ncbi:MAG: alpha-ribazole phosphatase [Patescibacteria group bacterium]|jgi:alpha-ribazole phosphatase